MRRCLAGWCNGSTTDSGSVSEGSNPSPAATKSAHLQVIYDHSSQHLPDPTKKLTKVRTRNIFLEGLVLVRIWVRQLPTDSALRGSFSWLLTPGLSGPSLPARCYAHGYGQNRPETVLKFQA